MVKLENDCVGCPDGIPCFGNSCTMKNVPHYYCDKCGDEAKLYEYEDEQLCEACLLKRIPVVEGSE